MRPAAPRPCTAAFASLLAACAEPEPRQWIVSVATDAPVPQLGDQLLIEVVHGEEGCRGCVRIVEIDGPAKLPASFGVVPPEGGSPVRVHAQLFRSEQAGSNGLPEPPQSIDPNGPPEPPKWIDAVGRLPPLEGEDHVALDLSMNCFGPRRDKTEQDAGEALRTCDPTTGTFVSDPVLRRLVGTEPRPRPGSWPPAREVPCPSDLVLRGMVCVPGGVFLLGSPLHAYVPDLYEVTLPEHLVKLHPFTMDIDEVSVGLVRTLVSRGKLTSAPRARDPSPLEVDGACTFLGVDSPEDDHLPVNCISKELAEEVCCTQGKRLPTEAEWEYAAGNLGAETLYPWGDDDPSGGSEDRLCDLAVLGVGRRASELSAGEGAASDENTDCRRHGAPSPVGPAVAGLTVRDRTFLGIENLAGSLREWVEDTFGPYWGACWKLEGSPPEDPVCKSSVPAPLAYSVRGSSWAGYKFAAKASARGEVFETTGDPYTGFRCVKSTRSEEDCRRSLGLP